MVKACRIGELCEEQIPTVTECVGDKTSVARKVLLFEWYAMLYGFVLVMGSVPVHGFDEILCTSDESCAIQADQPVASFAAIITHTARECKDIASVVEGDGGGDERSSTILALCHQYSVGKARNNAVACQKVLPLGLRACDVFGEDAASLSYHRSCHFAMLAGIDTIQTVCHYTYRRNPAVEGSLVGRDIDAKCQAADDDDIGDERAQIVNEAMCKVASVLGTVACAYDTDYVWMMHDGLSELEEYGRRIGTFGQALGIAFAAMDEGLDVMVSHKLQLAVGTIEKLIEIARAFQQMAKAWQREQGAAVGLEDCVCRAVMSDELSYQFGIDARDGQQRQYVAQVLIHIS